MAERKFPMTPQGYRDAISWLRNNNLEHELEKEQSKNGIVTVALANQLYDKVQKDPSAVLGCLCQSCGRHYRGDLVVSNEVWEQIKPEGKPEGAGLLCGSCILHRIVTRNIGSAVEGVVV